MRNFFFRLYDLSCKQICLSVFFIAILLTGCSGSSSSGSTVSAAFAGVYEGPTDVVVEGVGLGTASDRFPMRIVVGVDGTVAGLSPGSSADSSCDGEGEIRQGDNALFVSGNYTCRDPYLGVCSVPAEFNIAFNSAAASIMGTATYNCSVGVFRAQFVGYLPKVS